MVLNKMSWTLWSMFAWPKGIDNSMQFGRCGVLKIDNEDL